MRHGSGTLRGGAVAGVVVSIGGSLALAAAPPAATTRSVAKGATSTAAAAAASTAPVPAATSRGAGVVGQAAVQPPKPFVPPPRMIRAGDWLEVSLVDVTPGVQQTVVVRVNAQGDIALPMLTVGAGGRTEGGLEEHISRAYADAGLVKNCVVTVRFKE